jgi:hypothetical protein
MTKEGRLLYLVLLRMVYDPDVWKQALVRKKIDQTTLEPAQ